MVLCIVCKKPFVTQVHYQVCDCCGKPARWFKPCYICKHWAGVHGKSDSTNQCFVMAEDEQGYWHEVCICCVGSAERQLPVCWRCPTPSCSSQEVPGQPAMGNSEADSAGGVASNREKTIADMIRGTRATGYVFGDPQSS